jgi:hypothetical protein
MDVDLFLWNSLIAILAVTLFCVLARLQQTLLLIVVLALTLFSAINFFALSAPDSKDTMGFVKLMFLLPIGLGPLLTFGLLSPSIQQRYLREFTLYINFAVTANIVIMIFTPDGDTYRGLLSRLVCLALALCLVGEMAKVKFQTTFYDQGLFLFRSSPLAWIFIHAPYRLSLVSLPVFDTSHYLLLEPLSLLTMLTLYRLQDRRHPISYYFGFADTLAVSTLTMLSHFPIPPPFLVKGPSLGSPSQDLLDLILVPIQIVVLGMALWIVVVNRRKSCDSHRS